MRVLNLWDYCRFTINTSKTISYLFHLETVFLNESIRLIGALDDGLILSFNLLRIEKNLSGYINIIKRD